MIIDGHCHFLRMPADEKTAGDMAKGLLLEAERAGIKKPLDEVMPIYRDYMDDSECDKLTSECEKADSEKPLMSNLTSSRLWHSLTTERSLNL